MDSSPCAQGTAEFACKNYSIVVVGMQTDFCRHMEVNSSFPVFFHIHIGKVDLPLYRCMHISTRFSRTFDSEHQYPKPHRDSPEEQGVKNTVQLEIKTAFKYRQGKEILYSTETFSGRAKQYAVV